MKIASNVFFGMAACGVFVASALCGSLPQAKATILTGVTIEDYSTHIGSRTPDLTINGAGFDEINGFHSTDANTMWHSASGLPQHVTYDLGANYDLSSLTLWNFNEGCCISSSVNSVSISVADSEGGSFTSLTTHNFATAPGNNSVNFGETVDLTSFVAANNTRLIRMTVNSNHGGGTSGYAEIRFDGSAVPEPSSIVLAGLGLLGLAGWGWRRSRC